MKHNRISKNKTKDNKIIRYISAILCSLTFTMSAQASSLLSNGSFESPVSTPNTLQAGTPTGWNFNGLTPFIFNGNAGSCSGTCTWPLSQDGEQFVDIGNPLYPIEIYQNFSIAIGGQYKLSWYDNTAYDTSLPIGPASNYAVNVFDSLNTSVGGTSLDAYHSGTWSEHTIMLNLFAGSYKLSFNNIGLDAGSSTPYDTLLDNATLTAVPVPAAIWLFGSGVAGLVGFGRRKGR